MQNVLTLFGPHNGIHLMTEFVTQDSPCGSSGPLTSPQMDFFFLPHANVQLFFSSAILCYGLI